MASVPDQHVVCVYSRLERKAQRGLALGRPLEEQLGAGRQQRQLDLRALVCALSCSPLQQVGCVLWQHAWRQSKCASRIDKA